MRPRSRELFSTSALYSAVCRLIVLKVWVKTRSWAIEVVGRRGRGRTRFGGRLQETVADDDVGLALGVTTGETTT